ncbi:MAG: hypothetical protein M1833_005484 [Piccolia ochrophora]|nr:MAG: hypothetical protein M1833_005484 [Piccolia ochrophora]
MGFPDHDLDALLRPFVVSEETLYSLARRFIIAYRELASTSYEQFLPTPLTDLPTGEERGRFLALDIGGSNLRVGFVELLGRSGDADGSVPSTSLHEKTSAAPSVDDLRMRRSFEKAWPIEEHLKMDQANDLFSWLGKCIAEVIADFVNDQVSNNETVPEEVVAGVTFSFPMVQKSIDEATLMPMGKGFAISSKVNLGALLLDGYKKHVGSTSVQGLRTCQLPRLKIAAITNDSVATLASLAYSVRAISTGTVAMGLIVGTGTNATVAMNLKDLHPSKGRNVSIPSGIRSEDSRVIVNTEWSIRGTAPPLHELGLVTKWDALVSTTSECPGFQPFEYMTSGRYMGELCRLLLLEIFTSRLGHKVHDVPQILQQRYGLTSTFLTHLLVAGAESKSWSSQLQTSAPAPDESQWAWTEEKIDLIRKVAKVVSKRSAGLIAAATIGLLACAGHLRLIEEPERAFRTSCTGDGDEEIVVAATGGVISQFPNYLETSRTYVESLLRRADSSQRVLLQEARDVGITGAGVLAGIVTRN